MRRAAVDTNVFISALIKPQGAVGPVLGYLRDRRYTLIYSDIFLDELIDKLALPRIREKYHLDDADIETVLTVILLRGEPVVPQRRIQVCRDPKDDMILEMAVAGLADYIVTGDKDLLELHPFEGIPIVGPAEFIKVMTAEE